MHKNDYYDGFVNGVKTLSGYAIQISGHLGIPIQEHGSLPEKNLTLEELFPKGRFPYLAQSSVNKDESIINIQGKYSKSPMSMLFVVNENIHPLGTIRYQSLGKILGHAPHESDKIEKVCKNHCRILNLSASNATIKNCTANMKNTVTEITEKMKNEKVAAVGIMNQNSILEGLLLRPTLAYMLVDKCEHKSLNEIKSLLGKNKDYYRGYRKGIKIMSYSAKQISDYMGISIVTDPDIIPEKDLTLKELLTESEILKEENFTINQKEILKNFENKFQSSIINKLFVVDDNNRPLGTLRYQSLSKILEKAPKKLEIKETCKDKQMCKILQLTAGEICLGDHEDCTVKMIDKLSKVTQKMRKERVAAVGIINNENVLKGLLPRSVLAHILIKKREEVILKNIDHSNIIYRVEQWARCHYKPKKKRYLFDKSLLSPYEILDTVRKDFNVAKDIMAEQLSWLREE